MKPNLLILLFVLTSVFAVAQDSANKVKKSEIVDDQKNSRVSFVVGPGASYVTRKLYNDPAINQTNNFVIIDRAPTLKSNLAFGIIYTPYVYTIYRTAPYLSSNGGLGEKTDVEVVPKGITGAIFINPINFTKASDSQSFLSMTDFGIGLGYRFAGGIVVMATAEYFSVKQPRDWFINEYNDKSKAYTIDGAVQKSIDLNDKSIFVNKSAITFGFKVCYSFDIVKNYLDSSKKIISVPPTPVSDSPEVDPKPTDEKEKKE